MKKISFLSMLAIATMATAQVQVTNPENLEIRKATFQSVENTSPVTMEEFSAKKAIAETQYAAHDYYYTDGMLHTGYDPNFYGLSLPRIMLPYLDSVVWNNLWGPTDWYLNSTSTLLAENSETYVTGYGIDGSYHLPYTTDHKYTYTKQDGTDTIVDIKGYRYAESADYSVVASARTPITISTGYNIPMTLCGMETALMDNENGSDFYQVGAGTRGSYAHGTNLYTNAEHTKRIDTIGSVVRNLSTMKISAINIPIYNAGEKDITTMLPEGASVKLEIFAADLTEGKVYTDSPLAETTFSAENYVKVNEYAGTIVAKFYMEDVWGTKTETPIWIDGDFYVRLTNFNETNCDFGIFSDYYTPGGTTLFTVNGKLTTLFASGSNLAIGYDGYWPTLVNDTTVNIMEAPVAGGVTYYGEDETDNAALFYTNVDPEKLEFDIPDWIVYVVDTTYFSKYNAIFVQFEALEALPTGETGRIGEVTIDADGKTYTMYIRQGAAEPPSAVDNVVDDSFLNDNKRYNLLGVEVDENYKGLVIRNGKKYLQ